MTLIAATVHNGKVHMVGDTYTGFGATVERDTREKVWIVGDKVIGAAGNVRPILVFRYGFQFPDQPEGQDDDTYMRFTFPQALRTHMQEHTHVGLNEDGELLGFSLLIGWRGRLWQVSGDLCVTESACGYTAIGSGAMVGLGALHVSRLQGGPYAALRVAAEAAALLAEAVRGPFTHLEEP